jgi:acetyl-CoA carboxylase beta subunit
MLLYRELEANLHVCRNCGHHFRIGAERCFKLLFDDGAFARIRACSLLGGVESPFVFSVFVA